jgi:hypothetical protein
MAYEVEWSQEASDDLARAPVDVAIFIVQQVDIIADDPLRNAQRSHFPYPLNCLVSHSVYEGGDQSFAITILFHFDPRDARENRIIIAGIGVQPY